MKTVAQEYKVLPLASLAEHPRNPNIGNVDIIDESIETNGFFGAIIVQKRTGFIIAGNHRFRVARAKGAAELPVIVVDVDDEAATRIMLVDNRAGRLGSDDTETLTALLQELNETAGGIKGTGYEPHALNALLATMPKVEATREWAGMPSYAHEDQTAHQRVIFHFVDQAAVDRMAELIGQQILPRTKYLWYPAQPEADSTAHRYENES